MTNRRDFPGGARILRKILVKSFQGFGALMVGVVLPAAAIAQDVTFDPAPTEACLMAVDVLALPTCIGHAADACMLETPGGDSTVGMGGCLWAEVEYWDARLNAAYTDLRALHQIADEELATLGSSAPSTADALQEMQRAWLPYRDAACGYERSLWGGGTGGGPAAAACLMRLTGEQALTLEGRLEQVRSQ